MAVLGKHALGGSLKDTQGDGKVPQHLPSTSASCLYCLRLLSSLVMTRLSQAYPYSWIAHVRLALYQTPVMHASRLDSCYSQYHGYQV
jgi:hypothetical protein